MAQYDTDWYLAEISRRSTKFGSRLKEMLDRYGARNLSNITLEQVKEYYDYLIANNINDSIKQ